METSGLHRNPAGPPAVTFASTSRLRMVVLIALTALVSAACSARAEMDVHRATPADTIFRYVSVGPHIPIVLGQPIPAAAWPLLNRTGPRSYAVRSGQFSGASAIEIRTTEDGRARAFAFAYARDDEGFGAKVDSYAESLGKPTMMTQAGERIARWEDARTRFELIERGGRLHALLSDLQTAHRERMASCIRRGNLSPA